MTSRQEIVKLEAVLRRLECARDVVYDMEQGRQGKDSVGEM